MKKVSFPKVKGTPARVASPAKRPLLYEALVPVVLEANSTPTHVSSWRSAQGQPASQLRSAARAHGYRINISTFEEGDLVFRLNGLLEVSTEADS